VKQKKIRNTIKEDWQTKTSYSERVAQKTYN